MGSRTRTWIAVGAVVAVLLVALGLVLRDTEGTRTEAAPMAAAPGPVAPVDDGVADVIGVATYNVQWRTQEKGLRADRDRLTSRRGLDLIGFQETNSPQFRALNDRYRQRGWETWSWEGKRTEGPAALAVSWRTQTLELLDVDWVHVSGLRLKLAEPHPPRWVVRAHFRHRASGRTVTLLNTHVQHNIEEGQGWRPGPNARSARKHLRVLAQQWREVPGDVVLSTGDYNFDFRDDALAVPKGGITDRFSGLATSSFAALGHEYLPPTLRSRWIDYVFLADRSERRDGQGAAQFVSHRVLTGMNSDHRPLVARVRLYS